jgi:N-acyl-L-homoserine lactone synthetase
MIRIVTKDNAERHVGDLYQMHRIRKAVFKDRLGWDVTVSGELEVDEYAVGAPIAAVRPVLLERYFASLRLPEVVSDARMPATAK